MIHGVYRSEDKEFKEDRIFLLGHSLGGMLAPRIAERTDKLEGIIILAGTINDLLELIPKQAKYLASLTDLIYSALNSLLPNIKTNIKNAPVIPRDVFKTNAMVPLSTPVEILILLAI